MDTEGELDALALVDDETDAVAAVVTLPPSIDWVELEESEGELETRGERVVEVDVDALRDSSPLRVDERFDDAVNVELVLTVEDKLDERDDEPDAAGDVETRALDDADTPTDNVPAGDGFDEALRLDETEADLDTSVERVIVPDGDTLRDSTVLFEGVDRVV